MGRPTLPSLRVPVPMIVPAWLIRLMWRPRLSAQVKLGPEDLIAIEVADMCRAWTIEDRLRAVFWHTANEAGGGSDKKRREIQMAKARALGMIPGTPDLVFIGDPPQPPAALRHTVLLIELKSAKGRRSDNQGDFAAWANHHNITYLICRSLAEVEEALTKHGLLLRRRAP